MVSSVPTATGADFRRRCACCARRACAVQCSDACQQTTPPPPPQCTDPLSAPALSPPLCAPQALTTRAERPPPRRQHQRRSAFHSERFFARQTRTARRRPLNRGPPAAAAGRRAGAHAMHTARAPARRLDLFPGGLAHSGWERSEHSTATRRQLNWLTPASAAPSSLPLPSHTLLSFPPCCCATDVPYASKHHAPLPPE